MSVSVGSPKLEYAQRGLFKDCLLKIAPRRLESSWPETATEWFGRCCGGRIDDDHGRGAEYSANGSVAQGLLQAAIPLAWRTPGGRHARVVPMFPLDWQGIPDGPPPNAPKMKVLADHPDVAFTSTATNGMPGAVRPGTASVGGGRPVPRVRTALRVRRLERVPQLQTQRSRVGPVHSRSMFAFSISRRFPSAGAAGGVDHSAAQPQPKSEAFLSP
jgi:hypothetical protein